MKDSPEDIPYQIALLEITHVGPRIARKVIEHFGSAKNALNASSEELTALGKVGKKILSQRSNEEFLNFAKAQEVFCESIGAQIISYYSSQYPYRLKECVDAPLVMFQQGNCNLNAKRVVAIVGTRNCSTYGKEFCKSLIEDLKKYDVMVVSGLAYGIDACAHREAINQEMYNIGVVAHGLDRMYPSDHRRLAQKVIEKGAVLTDFPTQTNPDRENFPKRNRIVAGMVDAVIVIESAIKGGSMITAKMGNSYNRDVFAVPGRIGDTRSEGCNHLIKTHQANLLEKVEDIAYILGWEKPEKKDSADQGKLLLDLSEDEHKILSHIKQTGISLDEIVVNAGVKINQASSILLLLELKGIVKQLPGKIYQVV